MWHFINPDTTSRTKTCIQSNRKTTNVESLVLFFPPEAQFQGLSHNQVSCGCCLWSGFQTACYITPPICTSDSARKYSTGAMPPSPAGRIAAVQKVNWCSLSMVGPSFKPVYQISKWLLPQKHACTPRAWYVLFSLNGCIPMSVHMIITEYHTCLRESEKVKWRLFNFIKTYDNSVLAELG